MIMIDEMSVLFGMVGKAPEMARVLDSSAI
jgi:hypothetical protein